MDRWMTGRMNRHAACHTDREDTMYERQTDIHTDILIEGNTRQTERQLLYF